MADTSGDRTRIDRSGCWRVREDSDGATSLSRFFAIAIRKNLKIWGPTKTKIFDRAIDQRWAKLSTVWVRLLLIQLR